MTTMLQKELFDVKETAFRLNVSHYTIRNLVYSGKLKPVRIGSRILFDNETIVNFIEKNKEKSDE